MSEVTREVWAEFERLRNADFARLEADEVFRRRHERGPQGNGKRETVNCEPFDWRKKPEPKVRKTVHGLKDDGRERAHRGRDLFIQGLFDLSDENNELTSSSLKRGEILPDALERAPFSELAPRKFDLSRYSSISR